MDALRLIGREIEGFRVLDVLGEGGMGVVYKAEEVLLGRTVAIKLILPAYAKDEGLRKRFGREARALARLNNPHIVAESSRSPAPSLIWATPTPSAPNTSAKRCSIAASIG